MTLLKQTKETPYGYYNYTQSRRKAKQKVRFQPLSSVATPLAIEELCDTYNEAIADSTFDSLKASSDEWVEGKNSYEPFIRYMLGVILRAYKEFSKRVEGSSISRLSKQERIKAVFDSQLGRITKSDIKAKCPDISERTIARALSELQKSGYIELINSGRNAAYGKRGN